MVARWVDKKAAMKASRKAAQMADERVESWVDAMEVKKVESSVVLWVSIAACMKVV